MTSSTGTIESQVQIDGTELVIPCRPHQAILEAAYEVGIALPYACRRGICGLCAAELVQGEVAPIDALPITNGQCGPNQVLLCRCSPATAQVILRPTQWVQRPVPRRLPPL